MKSTFTLLFGLTLAAGSFAQNVEFHQDGVVISGSAITIDSSQTADHSLLTFYLVNKTSGPISVDWSRTRRANKSGYFDQICDDVLCFDADNATYYPRPTSLTIPAGDSSIFQPKVYPGGVAGCAIYTYIVTSNHGVTYEDSVQVKYRFGGQDCFLDIPNTPITYSVYPNPASNYLNIKVATNGNNVQVKIYNIMGELVSKSVLTDGQNTVSVSELNNGIYFYSIIKNDEIVETKKFIVRH